MSRGTYPLAVGSDGGASPERFDRCRFCGHSTVAAPVTTGATGGWLFRCENENCRAEWTVTDKELGR